MFTESWMLASPLPPSFQGTYKRSTSTIGCRRWTSGLTVVADQRKARQCYDWLEWSPGRVCARERQSVRWRVGVNYDITGYRFLSTNLPDCRTTPELFDYSECFWLDGIRQNKLGYERWNKRSRSWKFQADSELIDVSNCLQVSSQNRCRHISTKKGDSNPEVSSSIPTIPTINRVFPRRLSSLAHKPPSNMLQSWDMTV